MTVHVDVYVTNHEKNKYNTHVSRHASGQQHVKFNNEDVVRQEALRRAAARGTTADADECKYVVPPRLIDPPATICAEEKIWAQSFENFDTLKLYKGEPADAVVTIEVPTAEDLSITFCEISIGRVWRPARRP